MSIILSSALIVISVQFSNAAFERDRPTLIGKQATNESEFEFCLSHPFGISALDEHTLDFRVTRGRYGLVGDHRLMRISDGELKYAEYSGTLGMVWGMDWLNVANWIKLRSLAIEGDRENGFGLGVSLSSGIENMAAELTCEIPIGGLSAFMMAGSVCARIGNSHRFGLQVETDFDVIRYLIEIGVELWHGNLIVVDVDPGIWQFSVGLRAGCKPIFLKYRFSAHPLLPATHALGLVVVP